MQAIHLRRHPYPHWPLRRCPGDACAPTIWARCPLKALMDAQPAGRLGGVEDIIYGCANQAGEDNRNVARMSGLLAGLPIEVPGTTVNRLCGSGMDCGRPCRALDQVGRNRADDRRRRGEHVACALCHGQGESPRSRAALRSLTPPSAGALSTR
jgi:hypothetical protein